MDRAILMAIVLAFLVVLLVLMLVGWLRRQRRQSGIPRPQSVPDVVGSVLLSTEAFYVATTATGEPLNRIAVAGLGYRARAQVVLSEHGLSLAIPGQEAIFIPAAALRAVEHATWTIDRVVEKDGMTLIRWVLPHSESSTEADNTEVDSYLRIVDPVVSAEFFDAAHGLCGQNKSGDRL